MKHNNFNQEFSIEEASKILSAGSFGLEYGLDKIQSVLNLTDDDITEILLNHLPVHWHKKIMEWYSDFLNDCYVELNSNN